MPSSETGLGPALASELTTLAICWQIIRQDGIALGLTTHDRPLLIDGMRYESAPGMAPSAIVSTDNLDIDTMEVAGALRAGSITRADLEAGRYDGASLSLFMVDWRNLDAGRQVLATGTLGTTQAGIGSDLGFAATLLGLTAALNAAQIETYSPECRAELGDWRCRVSLRHRTRRVTVLSADGENVGINPLDVLNVSDFASGELRVLDGPMAGIDRRIVAVSDAILSLDEPLAIAVGTRIELREGCDKRFSTCVDRFENAAHFRGEPHVPGGDILTRFGGF